MIRRLLAISFLITAMTVSLHAVVKPNVEDVASKLSCYCGTCPHLVVTECGCSTAEQIMVDIQKMIDSGMSKDQIVQSYVAQYGQTVLSAPPKHGFNLTAWIIPFFGFAIGGVALLMYLRKQKSTKFEEKEQPQPMPPNQEEAHYREMLERELEQRK